MVKNAVEKIKVGKKGKEFEVGEGCYSTQGGLLPEKVASKQDRKWVMREQVDLKEECSRRDLCLQWPWHE